MRGPEALLSYFQGKSASGLSYELVRSQRAGILCFGHFYTLTLRMHLVHIFLECIKEDA